VQLVFLEVLQQGAAVTVHDALGNAGGARGEHDEQRVRERQRRKFDVGMAANGAMKSA
jgi:hypothetical protein